jgi:hypothetical protein
MRWTSDSSGEQRHGVVSIPAKGSQRLDQSGSEGWRGGRGSFWVLGFGRGGAAVENFGGRHGGWLGGREEEEREKQQEGRARIGLYRGTSRCRREGEGEQMRGQAQVDGWHRRVPWACVAAARHRRPGVAGREGASRGGAGGGQHVAQERAALGQQSLGRTAGEGGGVAQRGNRGAGAGGRRRGLSCDFLKVQGPHCNVLVTFKPELKWKWAQKKKCRDYQDLQLCFKV